MSKPACSLSWLASRRGPVTGKQVEQIRYWVAADWESHDVSRDATRLIGRLADALAAYQGATQKRVTRAFYERVTNVRKARR